MFAGTPTVGRAANQTSPSVPSMGTVPVHTNDSDTPEASVSMEGRTSATHQPTKVESASPIANAPTEVSNAPTEVCKCVHKSDMASYDVLPIAHHLFVQYADA